MLRILQLGKKCDKHPLLDILGRMEFNIHIYYLLWKYYIDLNIAFLLFVNNDVNINKQNTKIYS